MSYRSSKLKKLNANNMPRALSALGTLKYRIILEGAAVGALVGVVVSAFRYSLAQMDVLRTWFVSGEDRPSWALPLGLGLLMLFAVLVTLFLKWEPLISGSGIPQVEGEFEGRIKPVWWRVLLLKFIGGLMAIGSGLALGREGPSIQLGAMTGKGFSRLRGRLRSEERMLIAAGAGAGLAAAFGAPLAGLVFVLEEIYRVFDTKVVLSTLASTIVADFISSFVFGLQPVIGIFVFTKPLLRDYWMIALLGVLLGVLGVLYNRAIALMQDLMDMLRPAWLKAVLAVLAVILVAAVFPMALGSGHSLIEEAGWGRLDLRLLALLLIVKFVYCVFSFSTGAPGGIFLPLLVLGGLAGGLFTTFASPAFGMIDLNIGFFVIVGMAGMFSSVVRAPLTGIILISEMTGALSNLLPLSLVALVAYVVAEGLGGRPVYEQLLDRMLEKRSSQSGSKAV
ncbi:MAG: ClC family H(+)/Cl(-) exchange transporter, partial [Firmicutes bacterium]|nr:ClC family H(+)/Cl(-) exchange transporter [Bacillota bacterium]